MALRLNKVDRIHLVLASSKLVAQKIIKFLNMNEIFHYHRNRFSDIKDLIFFDAMVRPGLDFFSLIYLRQRSFNQKKTFGSRN